MASMWFDFFLFFYQSCYSQSCFFFLNCAIFQIVFFFYMCYFAKHFGQMLWK
jgi:hypothetical protein